jgi:acetolactate synthase I/II/III large subunit
MNQLTGAEAFVRTLQHHGVKHIFGLCGDTSLPLYDALHRLDHGITHILTRDERHAGYMADVYARVTGRVGVCEGPSGGGATYILPGVVEASESSIPILAITTDISVTGRGRYTLTELDQEALYRPLTKWNRVIDQAVQIPDAIRQAFREMTTGRPGAAHIGLPFDVQKAPVDEDTVWGDVTLNTFPSRRAAADPAAVSAAAEALCSAKAPLIICGGGPVISGAYDEIQALAEVLEIPVATSVSGQGIIADNHPLSVGLVGSNGGVAETRGIVEQADLVFFIGCRAGSVTSERWRFPKPGHVKVVHLDVDGATIGANYPTDVAIVGDAKLSLAALVEEVRDRVTTAPQRQLGRDAVARAKAEKFAQFEALAASEDRPIKPERVIKTLNELMPSDGIIIGDPGTPCPYFSAFYRQDHPGRAFISNRAHGALGFSMAGAVGAAIGRPDTKIVCAMGDGSFGMSCGEMETIVRLGLPITMIVFSNSVFGWIKAGQKTGFNERYFSVDFSRTNHAAVAEAFGCKVWRVEDPADLKGALKAALEHGGPTLVDIVAQELNDAKAPVSEWVA